MCANSCQIARTLREKWPEAIRALNDQSDLFFSTGLPELDRLFHSGRGIPYGQLIEIKGGPSSGKTSLLFRLLRAGRTTGKRIAYVDFSNSLFSFFFENGPGSGVDLSRLLVVRPTVNRSSDPLKPGLRTAELLLRDRHVDIVVFDLVGQRTPLPIGLLHRLRLRTVRAKGLVIFLTQSSMSSDGSRSRQGRGPDPAVDIIPSSMASLRLEIERIDDTHLNRLRVTITKSRICAEGARLEVRL